jgi:hypothetical protein
MPTLKKGMISKVSKKEMSEAIKTSGYLLEQRVEPTLTDAGFYVQMNEAYPDPETGKSREIDIRAISATSVYKEEFIFPVLLCECENNSQPVVFFTKESPISFLHYYEVKVSGIPVKFWDKNVRGYMSLSDFTKMENYHHYCKGEVATQYCSFQLKKDKSSWMALHVEEQHDTLNSLIKALEYNMDDHFSGFVLPPKGEEEGVNIQIYYPLLILQGDLYSASLKNNHLVLKKSNHIQFRRELFLPMSKEVETYQIDVITEKYLKDYLKLIDTEINKVRRVFKRKKKQVRFSINKIIAEARKPKKKPDSYREYFDF